MKTFTYIVRVVFITLIFLFDTGYTQTNVACIGNSITWGNGLSARETQSYPSQLKALLGDNYIVKNYGEGGATLLQNTWKPYSETEMWGFSIATPHDVVIILLGTNDSYEDNWVEKAHFKEDYYDLIDDYKNYPGHEDPVFILGLPPPIFDESMGHRNAPIIDEIIPLIKQVAYETNTTIADFYDALNGNPELFIDGVHPTEVGAGIMAEVAYNAIQTALSASDPPPDTPVGLKTISGLTNINLEWHANIEDDLFSYTIFRSYEKGGVQVWIGSVPKPDTTFSDNNVELNHIYYYSIDAKDIHNNISSRTAAVAGQTLDNTPPAAPLNLQIMQEVNTIKLTWTPNSENDLSKYYIFRSIIEDDIQQALNIIGTVYAPKNDFNDISYDPATNYYYGVKAVDISGNHGLISNIVNITTISPPVSSDTTITVIEDTPLQFNSSDIPFSDLDNHQLNKMIFIDSDHFEYFSYNGIDIDSTITCEDISELMFTPDLDEYGDSYTAFTFKVVDSFGSTSIDTNIVIINVASVNDIPHIDPISDLYIMEDSHNILLPVSGINAGPANELQNLSIKVFVDDTSLVKVSDIHYYSPDDTGFVTIDPVENVFGIIPITIQIFDDGGTSNGGLDSSEITFYINISPINDPPFFNLLENIQIFEDSETTIELTGVQAGPWESDQQITMSVKSNNIDILPHPELSYNSPDTTAILTFSTIRNVFSSSSITITMSDNGGTEFGGKDSISYTIDINISPINDPPILDLLENIQIFEDSETTIELTGVQAGPWESDQQITMSVKSNNIDILPHPELSYNSPDTTAILTFSTIRNVFSSSSITITMSDNGGTEFGGKDSTSYTIPTEIISVNDKPSDFNIIAPKSDSTLVIDKSNYLNTFSVSWETSSDIENDNILYDIIFSGDLSALSRYSLTSTNVNYVLKEILAVTDTVSTANSVFSIIASDGDLQTEAINSGIAMIVDGRSFAPAKLHLDQNYPNPFNHATLIGFDLPRRANVSIIIYDLLGEEIIQLIDNKEYARGYNTITWYGLDKNNNLITTGIYIMQIRMGSVKQHKKLIFLK